MPVTMSNRSLYEDTDSGSLIDFADEASDADSLVQQDPIDEDAVIARQVAKALDAAEERTTVPEDEEEGLPPLAERSSNSVWLEHPPLRDAGPAPPDYSEATAWKRALLSRFSGPRNAEPDDQLYGEIRLPENNRPQSIPPEYTDEDSSSPFTFRRLTSNKTASKRRCWRYLFWIVGMYLVVSLLFSIPWIIRSRHARSIRRIAAKDHPSPGNECYYDTYSDYARYKFDNLSDFWFEYESFSELHPDISITRNLNVYPAPPTQEAAIEVWMNVATAKPYTVAKFSALERDWGLYVHDPVLYRDNRPIVNMDWRLTSARKESCADIWMAMFIRPELNWIRIWTDRVNTHWGYPDAQSKYGHRNISMPFFDLWTSTGNVDAHYLDSKYMDIMTETGSITGTFAFRESLTFQGASGKLDVTVDPQGCEESEPGCERFTVQSQLSAEGVKFPTVYPDHVRNNISFTGGVQEWWNEDNFYGEHEDDGHLSIYRKHSRWEDVWGEDETLDGEHAWDEEDPWGEDETLDGEHAWGEEDLWGDVSEHSSVGVVRTFQR